MVAIGQDHSKSSNRQGVESVHQSPKMAEIGSKRGYKSEEKGTRKTHTWSKITTGWEECATRATVERKRNTW